MQGELIQIEQKPFQKTVRMMKASHNGNERASERDGMGGMGDGAPPRRKEIKNTYVRNTQPTTPLFLFLFVSFFPTEEKKNFPAQAFLYGNGNGNGMAMGGREAKTRV